MSSYKWYKTALFFVFLFKVLSLSALGTQKLIVSYYDRAAYREQSEKWNIRDLPVDDTEMEKGMLILYQRVIGEPSGFICLYGGVDIGKWTFPNENVYTYSSFFASRFWGISFFGLQPYIEISLGAPTYSSKQTIAGVDMLSNFIFQHYFSVGIELLGVSVDLRAIRYGKDFTDGVTMPLIASAGFSF